MYLNIIDIIDKGGHISAWPAKRKMQMNLTWHNQLLWLDFVVDDNFLLTQLFTSWRKTVKVPEYRHFSSCQPRNESLLKEEDVVDLCRRCNYFWKGTSKQNSGRFTKLWETFVMKPFAEVYWQLLFMQRWIWTRENCMSDMFSVPENWRTVSTILIINHIFEYSKVIRTIDNIASIKIPKSF